MNHFTARLGLRGTSGLQTFIGPRRLGCRLRLLLIRGGGRGGTLRGIFQTLGWLTVKPASVRGQVRSGRQLGSEGGPDLTCLGFSWARQTPLSQLLSVELGLRTSARPVNLRTGPVWVAVQVCSSRMSGVLHLLVVVVLLGSGWMSSWGGLVGTSW